MSDRLPEQMAGIAVFARVVEAKSFSGAAKTLGTTKSAVSKQIARLETLMGVQLLRRTTRSVSLTDAGHMLYERAVHAIALCRDAEDIVAEMAAQPHGLLRVSAPVTFGRMCIAPLAQRFLSAHPDIQLQLVLLDRPVNLADEGFDLAIRLTRTQPRDVVAWQLASIRHVLCAAAGALAPGAMPRTPDDLTRLNCLRYGEGETNLWWHFDGPEGTRRVQVTGNMLVNSSEALRQAMLQGMGVTILPDFMVAEDLRAGRAVQLLPDWTPKLPFGTNAYAVWLPDRYMLPRTRLFLDYLSERFSPEAGFSSWSS